MISELVTLLGSLELEDNLSGGKLKRVKLKKKYNKIGSISAFSSNSIFYFPTVVVDQVTSEEAMMIMRMLDRTYASFVVACISLIPVHSIDPDDVNSITGYLSQFHQNIGMNTNPDLVTKFAAKQVLKEDATPSVREEVENYMLECWNRAKREERGFVNIVCETVSLNDMFNEDVIDPKTRLIQKRFKAIQEEVETWGFFGEATDTMFDIAMEDDSIEEEDEIINEGMLESFRKLFRSYGARADWDKIKVRYSNIIKNAKTQKEIDMLREDLQMSLVDVDKLRATMVKKKEDTKQIDAYIKWLKSSNGPKAMLDAQEKKIKSGKMNETAEDPDDYDDVINDLQIEDDDDVYYYDDEEDVEEDEFDDSILDEGLGKLFKSKSDKNEEAFQEYLSSANLTFSKFDFNKAYKDWYPTGIYTEKMEDTKEFAKKLYAYGMVQYGKAATKYMIGTFGEARKHYGLDKRACRYEDTDIILAFNLDDFGKMTGESAKNLLGGGRFFTDIIDNAVRINMDNDPKYKPKAYVDMKNIDAARQYLAQNESVTEYDVIAEAALRAAERKEIPTKQFGLPAQRKYPLHDEEHVRQAVKMFGHCPKEDQKELAGNIRKAMKRHHIQMKIGKDNPLCQYLGETVYFSEEPIQEAGVKSAINTIKFSLESVSENKIMSTDKLSKLNKLEAKLKGLKTKYTKYLNRYKKKYKENQANGSKSKLVIRFNNTTIGNPKLFMQEYGQYIKIVNKRLALIEKRRAQLRKRKGLEESAVDSGITEMDFQALDFCESVINADLNAPDEDIFTEVAEEAEDDLENDFMMDDELSEATTETTRITPYNKKSILSDMDVKRANDATPLFTNAEITLNVTNGDTIKRELLVGVKSYLHRARADEMVTNLYQCIINKRRFLRTIKFITGEERSLADLLFGIKQLKFDALDSRSTAAPWKATLKRFSRLSKISIPYLMKEYVPNGTIVVTMNEVEYMKSQHGIDLMIMDHIRMIMDENFLLGFVILDQENELVYVTYHGHGEVMQTYSYAMLEREQQATDRMMRELYRSFAR